MSGPLTLTLARAVDGSLDLAGINPTTLAGKSLAAIRRTRIPHGRATAALGELFTIAGDDPRTLRFRGLSAGCHRLGQGMSEGNIEVAGAVGAELGREMSGGRIRVSGRAGDGVGASMRGGCITLGGDAGDGVGAGVAGATRGMNGGLIIVGGNAGNRCGERMRRGFILILGDTGPHAGERMIAGTIAVLGRCGPNPGFGMRRGTLLLAEAPASMTPTFNDCGEFELGFMPLLQRYIGEHHRGHARRFDIFTRARRWCGDMAFGGTGELFVAAGR